MSIVAKVRIRTEGDVYLPGSLIDGLSPAEEERLIRKNAAERPAVAAPAQPAVVKGATGGAAKTGKVKDDNKPARGKTAKAESKADAVATGKQPAETPSGGNEGAGQGAGSADGTGAAGELPQGVNPALAGGD
jgi:hypothetical protein